MCIRGGVVSVNKKLQVMWNLNYWVEATKTTATTKISSMSQKESIFATLIKMKPLKCSVLLVTTKVILISRIVH